MNTDIFARFPAYDEQQLEAAIDQKNPAIRNGMEYFSGS